MVILKALFTIRSNKIEAAYHGQLYGVTLDTTNKFSATLPVEILFQSKETPYKETDKYIVKVLDITERQFAVEHKTLSNFQYTLSVDDLTIEELETMLNAGLALKANLTHTHAIADVVNLQTTLNGKANTSHTHTIAQVTNLQTTLDGKAANSHVHTINEVTGLQTSLDGKALIAHTHTIANVTGLQTALDAKAATTHTHTIAQITGLEARLAAAEAKIAALETAG